jgi:D-serine deaminase-like pyridoxal phosphate-dependent protein
VTLPLAEAAASAEVALIGRPWTEADTPALLVDLDRLDANIAEMASLARQAGVDLRPHFKTHKSVAIARRQIAAGAIGVTVAKLDEAAALIDGGVTDILLAHQVVGPPKLGRAMELASRSRLTLAVDGIEGARAISGAAVGVGLRIPVSIEIDCGLRRCGVRAADAAALASALSDLPGITLDGVFTHAGNSYAATSREQIEAIALDEAAAVREAAEGIRATGLAVRVTSAGSTPTAELVVREPGVTELRAGNYVFYDAMQVALGTIPADRPALTVSAVVVSRPTPERAVIDAGSKTFGLDKGAHGLMVVDTYGHVLGVDASLDRLSEEHGILTVRAESTLAVGDHVRIVPNHACAVGNLGRVYFGVRDGIIEEIIPIDSAGGVH